MVKLPGRASRKRAVMILIGGALGVGVIAFLLAYFLLFPTSSPKRFALKAVATGTATTKAGGAPSTATTGTSTATSTGSGTYQIASGSQAGYRVREKLAFLPAESDAVGRTSQVTGSATLARSTSGVTIKTASFSVAVNTLKSDKSMRDEKIHQIGLESDRYPTATFALSSPITLPASALTGSVVHVSATGVFNIHGVSKRETLPLEMTVSAGTLAAAGSLTFPWSEFGMTAPSLGGFVNVTGKATMEFDLRLTRA
jgi:polyisoprenoid-binding protein YceI